MNLWSGKVAVYNNSTGTTGIEIDQEGYFITGS